MSPDQYNITMQNKVLHDHKFYSFTIVTYTISGLVTSPTFWGKNLSVPLENSTFEVQISNRRMTMFYTDSLVQFQEETQTPSGFCHIAHLV